MRALPILSGYGATDPKRTRAEILLVSSGLSNGRASTSGILEPKDTSGAEPRFFSSKKHS